ncbi:MAG: hypothetical protein F6K28_53065 [Microcoleus sp. SIO2G3]|nr:hypothetical protein [Microcoleus sp. SIO2G3]
MVKSNLRSNRSRSLFCLDELKENGNTSIVERAIAFAKERSLVHLQITEPDCASAWQIQSERLVTVVIAAIEAHSICMWAVLVRRKEVQTGESFPQT